MLTEIQEGSTQQINSPEENIIGKAALMQHLIVSTQQKKISKKPNLIDILPRETHKRTGLSETKMAETDGDQYTPKKYPQNTTRTYN